MRDKDTQLVYSTDHPVSRKAVSESPAILTIVPPSEQKVKVLLEKKGRGGKAVTVIAGLTASESEMRDLLKKLKSRLGTGGAFKDGILEIQGDHREIIMDVLQKAGYRPKRSGG
ncbi:MAG: hypothetical protein ISR96_01160 [Nitrospira sp.]|nr:hypothetical protein [bacterium]MBL7048123.1 hypothetical protein [Nitrospira sp.]